MMLGHMGNHLFQEGHLAWQATDDEQATRGGPLATDIVQGLPDMFYPLHCRNLEGLYGRVCGGEGLHYSVEFECCNKGKYERPLAAWVF